MEDLESFRQDSTVVETNIHYPTNNSLVWDCIKESERLLKHLKKEIGDLSYEQYGKAAKKTYFKINVSKSEEERAKLFIKQLNLFTNSINQVSNIIKKKQGCVTTAKASKHFEALKELLTVMEIVYSMTERKEILKEKVSVEVKIFSIYKLHTDIIVKGKRDVQFGHKINLGSGKSNLILTCEIVEGNSKDSELYQPTIEKYKEYYGKAPSSSAADGGYASIENLQF